MMTTGDDMYDLRESDSYQTSVNIQE